MQNEGEIRKEFYPDDYCRNACREVINEECRLTLALVEIYNRNDVALNIPQMTKIFYKIHSDGNKEEIIGDALYELLKR
ncbi:hypothetical protein [Enterobacter sichuanensis]|uniref:hypothetical protein n=1 Tax=Enterobacter sichuanensis TaxID=2071710 RepID=UPI00217DF49C|nr:hypothetical protein [Enterobacter sichuanensis]